MRVLYENEPMMTVSPTGVGYISWEWLSNDEEWLSICKKPKLFIRELYVNTILTLV